MDFIVEDLETTRGQTRGRWSMGTSGLQWRGLRISWHFLNPTVTKCFCFLLVLSLYPLHPPLFPSTLSSHLLPPGSACWMPVLRAHRLGWGGLGKWASPQCHQMSGDRYGRGGTLCSSWSLLYKSQYYLDFLMTDERNAKSVAAFWSNWIVSGCLGLFIYKPYCLL